MEEARQLHQDILKKSPVLRSVQAPPPKKAKAPLPMPKMKEDQKKKVTAKVNIKKITPLYNSHFFRYLPKTHNLYEYSVRKSNYPCWRPKTTITDKESD